jgi:cysteine desulfurase/selenocysteine lyase
MDVDELTISLRDETRLLCVSWVNSYTGQRLDLKKLATSCHRLGVRLIVNGTQGIGAIPIDVKSTGIDAISASGFKWLCGPYATGFAWIDPSLLDVLQPTQSYWLAQPADAQLDLDHTREPELRSDLGARAFDVFGTANFLSFEPWLASIEFLLRLTIETVEAHDQLLVERIHAGLDFDRLTLLSPKASDDRSAIIALNDRYQPVAKTVEQLANKGIDVATREGHLRVSAHVHNSLDDVDRLLEVLGAA